MSTAQLTDPPPALPAPPQHAALPAPAPDPGDSNRGGLVRKILVVLLIVIAVGATIWKIRSNAAAQATTTNRLNATADRAIPVLVTSVQQKTMPIYLTALGTVTPYYSVTIKSRVDGQLLSVNVREGQAVRKGQLLAEIDPAPYNAALAQAQGQLIKDQANAANANAEAQRYTALLDAGVVSRESQQSQVSTAGQAAGSIVADQASIQAAKVNVAYTRITSPIDGIVGLRQVDPGNIVHASDATGLILVTQLQPIAVIFTLPEDQLPEVLDLVRGGKKLTVEAYDRSETTHLGTGTLLTLDNSIDPTTGTDKVKAVFPNKDGALFPNQFVNVRLILQQRQDAIVVPASAIQSGSQGNFIYVVKKGNPPASLNGGAPGAGGGGRRGKGAGGGAGNGSPAAGGSAAASGSAPLPGETSPAGTGAPGSQAGGQGPGQAGGRGANTPPYYVVAQPVVVDVTEGTQVILKSGVNPGDQIVIDGQEKLLNGSKVNPKVQDASGNLRPASQASGGPSDGPNSAAFGPGGPGPGEPASDPTKRGIETGTGVPARGPRVHGAPLTPDATDSTAQPHHHRPNGSPAGQQQ